MSGDQIQEFDAVHFAVSVDKPEDSAKFAQMLGVDYPLLSDPTRQVALAYGVVKDGQGYAVRWTFYIGTDGKILFIDKAIDPATAGEDVVRRLSELGVSRRSPRD